jgi:bifunctional oligoribonuclease and PAP phosphatase NrnA
MALSPQSVAAAVQAIEQHQRLLVIPHANVDADGLSSALACFQLFQALGKDVTVICPDTLPESLRFMPGFEKLEREVKESQDFVITINMDEGVEVDKLRYTVEDSKVNIIVVPKKGHIRPQQIQMAPGEHKYDLIVVVDTADLSLLGSMYTDHIDLFSEVPILNIDHHISNTQFGQLHLIDPTSASATEVLYALFMQVPSYRDKITPDMATLLLTGLITDTRSFQNPNTTPHSLEVAAQLLERGARQQEIIQNIYKTKPLSTLRIWGRALNRIQVDSAARIVWSSVSKEDLAEMEAKSKETHGILDELISTIPDADVHVLFTETEEGGLKASMRSSAVIDSSLLSAQTYGGGGHARAAGFKVKSFDNFQLQVLECIQKLKDGMQKQKAEAEEEATPLPQSSVPVSVPVSQPKPQPQSQAQTVPQGIDVVSGVGEKKPDAPASGERDIIQDLTK